jgi:hypothetical protein
MVEVILLIVNGFTDAVVDAFTEPLAFVAVTTNVHGPVPVVTEITAGEVIVPVDGVAVPEVVLYEYVTAVPANPPVQVNVT